MKLHLPVRLFKSVLACLAAVASFSLGSGVAWAEAQNLTFSGSSLTWDTSAENKSFVDEEDDAASFAAGDNVSFTGESAVTLGENITAGTLDIAAGADVTIDLEEYTLHTDTISLSGTLAVGDSLSIASGSTLAVRNAAAVLDSALVLGEKSGLVVESSASLNNNSFTLNGGSNLILTAAGDGKTYTLLSGISSLLDKNGNTLTAGSYSVNDYFDKDAPGSGFWADASLVYTADGTLQIVLHGEEVREALTITTRQTGSKTYNYYEGVCFRDITYTASGSSAEGGAIEGGTITLSNNGSVTFSGNTASGSYRVYGGAIYDNGTITLSNNGSVTFSGNTASGPYFAEGGAIYDNGTITLSNNGSVTFSGNTASGSYSAQGGAIYVGNRSIITLNDNGSVTFSGNTASSGSSSAEGGAIEGGTITLSNNGSVTFSGNTASSGSSYVRGGAIDGYTITLSNNGSVTFGGNAASSGSSDAVVEGGAIYGYTITLSNNGSVTFSGNTASSGSSSAEGGAIYAALDSSLKINNNGETIFRGNYAHPAVYGACGGAIYQQLGIFSIQNNASVVFEKNYTLQEETLRLQSICASAVADGTEKLVNFSAPKGGKIEFRDSIYIDVGSNSASSFHLNNWYVDDAGERVAQTGDIIFTGEDATAENLKEILAEHGIHREATVGEIRLSKTSEVWGTMQLHDGRLIVRDGAIIVVDGITVHGSASGLSTPTLWLDNGELRPHLNYQQNAIWISGGSALHLSGQNTARYSTLTLSVGSTFIIDVAAAHTTTAALTLNSSTLSLGGTITLQLNAAEGLNTAGRYMLLSGVSAPTDWASNITVSGGVWTIDDLSWVNNILYLNFPTLTEATWNNLSGDRLWNVNSSVNWEQHDIDYAYKDGIGVIFGDEGAGKVTLVGTLTPASVLVNSTGNYSFEGSGSLSGGMTLTKQGSGTLSISTANSYTGGTMIEAGTVVAKHAAALGTGMVTLAGGTLEIAVTGVGNTIANTGTSTLKVANGITHGLTGTIANSGELTLTGNFDASKLDKSESVDVYVDVLGNETASGSGFTRSGDFTVSIANGTVDSTGASVSYKGTTLEMTGGVGLSKGGMLWGEYRILSGHEVELSAIVNKAVDNQVSSTNIQLNGGKLTANRALTGTLSISGTSTLHGVDFNLGNAPLQNNGDLTLTGSFDASGLSKTKTWNSYVTTSNEVSTDGSGFLREGDFEVTVVTGTGTVDSSGVTAMKYGSQNLTMDGAIGTGVGAMQYDTYRILSGHTASSSAIHGYDEGKGMNALITLADGGTLNADDATTETKVNATGGSINLSAGTLSGTVGGSTIVTVSGTATMSGDNSYTGGTTLNGAALTVTHANALGTGVINTTGESSLTSAGVEALVLHSVISNSGELTLIGNYDASKLAKSESADVYVDVLGNETAAGSGFTRSGDFTVSIANGTVDSTGASVSYKGTTLEMTGGVGLSKGGMLWGEYRILSGHEVELSAIVNKAADNQVSSTNIQLNGGKLTADRALTGTLSISGISALHGVDFNLGNAPLQNNGDLTLTGSFDASGLSKSKTWNSYVTISNEVSTDGCGFLREGDFEVTVVDGTGTVDSSGVTAMKYGSQNLTMDGAIGTGVGKMQYDTYRILSGHTASSSAIHGYDEGKGKNALIRLADGGTLNADDATTETKVNAMGGSINLSAGTLSGTVGGSTIVTVSGTATMSGDNSYTGGTTLNGAALTVTHANALGTGSIVSTGKSSLTVEGTAPLVLSEVISNAADGELTLAGAFDASALEYHVDSDGRIDLDGNDVDNTASGFAKDVKYWVQIVDGGTTPGTGAHISHREHLSRQPLALGTDGVASTGGFTDYTHFWLEGEDRFSVSEISGVSFAQAGVELLGVTMRSGELTVDKSVAVNAEGGNIVLSTPAVTGESVKLSGTIADTAVSSLPGAYDSTISATMEGTSSLTVNGGTITVSGDNSYTGGTTVNGGKLVAGSNTAFGSGDVAVNDGGTLDLGACIITNRVLLSGDATLAHADGASNILLQSGANADFANGFELSAGKSLTVGAGMAAFARSRAARVGGTIYHGALTLGGGELTLNEHLTVEGHVNFGADTTTIVNVAGWQGAEAGTELASFSSNSGYTEESLTLRGAAAGLVLNFDAATGVLSLVAAQQPLPPAPPVEPEFVPNLNRNQQEVYDTVKDIVAGGEKPEGELGKLVELISGSRNEAELRELLDAVGGSEYATLMSSQLDGNLAHVRNLRNRMGSGWELVGNNYMRAMIEMFGQHSEVDGDAHGRGYTRSEMGGQFTLEFIGCMHMSSGVALASGHTRLNPDDALRQSVNNNYVDFYTTYRGHGHCNMGYSAKFSLGIGTHDYNLRRNVPGTSTTADADGFSVNFMHESAYIVRLSQGSSLQVFGVVESSFSSIGGFREKGAGTASLVMESQDAWATDITLGLRYVQLLDSFALPQATLTLQAGVTAGVGDTSDSLHLHFAGAPDKRYYQTGADRNRRGYNLGVGLHVPVSNTSAFYMSGETILRGDSYEWNGNVGFQIAF